MSLLETILDDYPDDTFLKADGFDDAIIGVWNGKLAYSTKACIDILTKDMSYEDAVEYFYYNVEGSYVGEKTPIFIDLYLDIISLEGNEN